MATNRKTTSGRSWKRERASVNTNKSKPKSNKYRPAPADSTKRPASSSSYWRGGYTRKDGTRVKGHYVRKPSG